MCESQVVSKRSVLKSFFASIAGALVVWLTAEYAATTEGYYDSEADYWDYVVSIEFAAFGVMAGWLLWEGLTREGGAGLLPKYLIPILVSIAFVGYAFLWLFMLLILFIDGKL